MLKSRQSPPKCGRIYAPRSAAFSALRRADFPHRRARRGKNRGKSPFETNRKSLAIPETARLLLLEVTPGFEPGNEGFADPCLTTWLCHRMEKGAKYLLLFFCGAGDEARTRYLHLGKVALYQMSYARKWCLRSESNQRHADFQSAALPTELQRHIKPLLQPDNGDHEGTRTLDLRRDRPAF